MPTINAERLLADLRHLATFGKVGTGVCRAAMSPEDIEARHWLVERMRAAGLDAEIDRVGNVLGRSRRRGPALLIGSHSDSQPRGGWLDGSLGVIYGLEIARALGECDETADCAVDVISFQDEEGTLYGCLGSRAFGGKLTAEDIDAASSRDDRPLRDVIAAAGLSDRPLLQLDPERHAAYLEAHIEQGRVLDDAGEKIGVVTRIVGIRQQRIRFVGEANHAGTTQMPIRKDAGVALIDFAYNIRQVFSEIAGPSTVWTIGQIDLDPGAASIIPGAAEMTLQYRDPELERLDRLEEAVQEMAAAVQNAGVVEVATTPRAPIPPSLMDEGLQEHIAGAAAQHAPGAWRRMPSAAGHDPMILVDRLPCAMLFIPSIGGISHDFAEDSHEEDIALGCQVLATAAAAICRSNGR